MMSPTVTFFRRCWLALDPGERNMLRNTALLTSVTLVAWLAAIRPVAVLYQVDALQSSLDAQWHEMQALQAEAQALQSLPSLRRAEAQRALEASVKQHLGASAQLTVLSDRATITLRNIPAGALVILLSEARSAARAVPVEAHLIRNNSNVKSPATWDGTVVLSLPAQ